MATIEKLDSILTSKAAIKAAIQEKGVSCGDTLAEYANRIKAIPTGSSIKVEELHTTSITANGPYTITPSTGFDAMKSAKIDVNVPIPEQPPIVDIALIDGQTLIQNEKGIYQLNFRFRSYNEATGTYEEIPDNYAYEYAFFNKANLLLQFEEIVDDTGEPILAGLDSSDNDEMVQKGSELFIVLFNNNAFIETGDITGAVWYIPPIKSIPGEKIMYGKLL